MVTLDMTDCHNALAARSCTCGLSDNRGDDSAQSFLSKINSCANNPMTTSGR